ncbi:MAG: peptidoglycan-binding protein [Calditrichaeota bacterium]|nr:MAG: peptidoglycan-binding protein [Calditrichota bacterium]
MNKYFLILSFSFSILILPLILNGNEIVRLKIENSSNVSFSALNEQIHCSKSVSLFYQKRFFKLAWNSKTSSELLTAIKEADQEGLNPRDYHFEKLQQFLTNSTKTEFQKAELDILLTDAFLLYTSHLFSGKVNPQTIDAEWHVVRREGNPLEILENAIESGDIKNAIQATMPKHEIYKNLKKTLKIYREKTNESWANIPIGETIKENGNDERLSIIRERLFILGDLKDKTTENPSFYDENLFKAIQLFQKRNGLEDDGNIGKKTIATLNISLEQRINQIEANLERWRWLQQEFGNYYLKVNIANFELEVIKDGKLIRTHKIIVGKPFRKTPVFSSKMQYLVLNPTWTVPPGILNADVLPAVKKDVSYLEKKKLSVLDNQGNQIKISEIDWNSKAVKGYTYRQPPGPENALGAVKFMFPNQFHVYLHDTPSKELFSKNERAFSSGCIRVQESLVLAEYFLNDEVNWNRESINKVVETRKTQTVQLKEQPNVHLLYWTAWVDSNGNVNFRNDIYERDKPLLDQLNEKPPILRTN